MRRQLLPAVRMFLVFTVLCGLAYTFAITGIAQLVWLGGMTVPSATSWRAAAGDSHSPIGPPNACFADEVHHTMSRELPSGLLAITQA